MTHNERFIFAFDCIVDCRESPAQLRIVDSLKTLIVKSHKDIAHVKLLQELAETFRVSPDLENLDSALYYGTQSLTLARNINDKRGEIRSLIILGKSIRNEKNPIKAIEYFQQGLRLSEEQKDTLAIITGLKGYALLFYYKEDFRQLQQRVLCSPAAPRRGERRP